MRDLYLALGLRRGASGLEIKRAYRRLMHRFHPDRNPGRAWASERFVEVAHAYEVLRDAERRALYDKFGEPSLRAGFVPPVRRAKRPKAPPPPQPEEAVEELEHLRPTWRDLRSLLGY